MAILRSKDIMKLTQKEREEKVKELKKELMKLKSQVAMGNLPESPGKVRAIKRTLARIYTLSKRAQSPTKGGQIKKK